MYTLSLNLRGTLAHRDEGFKKLYTTVRGRKEEMCVCACACSYLNWRVRPSVEASLTPTLHQLNQRIGSPLIRTCTSNTYIYDESRY